LADQRGYRAAEQASYRQAFKNGVAAVLARAAVRGETALRLYQTGERHRQVAGLVLLPRCDALTAVGRADALNRAAGLLTCCWHPQWVAEKRATGRWSFGWCWWLQGHAGRPTHRLLVPKHRRGELFFDELRRLNAMLPD
jgi:hypothetical protein